MNQVVVASYKAEKQDMLRGLRSLRTYREGMPVTTTKASIEFSQNDKDGHSVVWKLGRSEQIEFAIYYGRDKANYRLTIQRILTGENDYSAPQIQLKDRDLFLLLPLKEPERGLDLDKSLFVGVDLGIVVPAYVALSEGPGRRAIGSREDFLRVRTQMQARLRNLQRNLKSVHGGKGRQKKIRALERVKDRERNFARMYNHYLSKEIVDFAVRNRAATIKMEMLEGFGEDESHEFVLRNWSYFDLQRDIDYKAKRVGVAIIKVDPYHTSQTCSQCGHCEPGQRQSQAEFVCAKCGVKVHADYNAALNIARSDKIVEKKEDCEYYKQKTGENGPVL
jgi:putative transposase